MCDTSKHHIHRTRVETEALRKRVRELERMLQVREEAWEKVQVSIATDIVKKDLRIKELEDKLKYKEEMMGIKDSMLALMVKENEGLLQELYP
jgi:hypothetical protein